MDLKNGYKVMYEAKERITEEKPGPIYGSKGIPSLEDAMLISFNNGEEYIDLKSFKVIYSDGKHLFGRYADYPAREDVNIVVKSNKAVGGQLEIVLGEVIPSNIE